MNQKYQIIIQPLAQQAIEEAYFWLSNVSASKARQWLEGLYKEYDLVFNQKILTAK